MRVFPIIEWLHILSATVLFGTGIGHGEHESEPDQTSKNVETGSALDVRGGNCEPILIPPLPRAGEGWGEGKISQPFRECPTLWNSCAPRNSRSLPGEQRIGVSPATRVDHHPLSRRREREIDDHLTSRANLYFRHEHLARRLAEPPYYEVEGAMPSIYRSELDLISRLRQPPSKRLPCAGLRSNRLSSSHQAHHSRASARDSSVTKSACDVAGHSLSRSPPTTSNTSQGAALRRH